MVAGKEWRAFGLRRGIANDSREPPGRLQKPGVVDDEREIAVQELGCPPRQHHAWQEDLEVLHDRSDLGVDRELERDELFLPADLDLVCRLLLEKKKVSN